MGKIIFTLYVFLCYCISSWGFYRTIYCYNEKSDYTLGNMKVWEMPQLTIEGGSAINDGFAIRVDFSTSQSDLNKPIFSVGSSSGVTFTKALTITQDHHKLLLQRPVKIGNVIKEHSVDSWSQNMIDWGTNYSILLEIDETRCRYSIWETGNDSKKIYEYEFYGLTSSYMKDILSNTHGVFSIATSTDYRVEKLVVETLAHGYGVKVPDPKTDVVWGRIKNMNSDKYISLYNGAILENNLLVQHSHSSGAAELWEMHPFYQSSRTPLSFNARFMNLSSEMYLAILHCSIYNGTPVVNATMSDCDAWKVNRERVRGGYFNLFNRKTSTYSVVENASLFDNAKIVTWENASTTNALWSFEQQIFHYSIDTGCYTIMNKNSAMFVSPGLASYESRNIVQYPQTDRGADIWYIKRDDSGLYTIQNVDSKKYLVIENASLGDGANVVQWKDTYFGNGKWMILKQPDSNYYTITNINSGKFMVVFQALKTSGAPIIQYSTGEDNKLWEISPFNFRTPHKIGGIFRLKNVYTGLYLVVENASMTEGTQLVSWESADTPNGWWTFLYLEDGGYAIRNVNSQLSIVIENASMEEYAQAIQHSRGFGSNFGNSIWILEPDLGGEQNIYWLKNLHSGKYLYFSSSEFKNGTPAVQETSAPEHNLRLRWFLEPVVNAK